MRSINKLEFSDAVSPSDTVDSLQLAANVEETAEVPEGATLVQFSATADIWVKIGDDAITVPGDVDDGSAPTLNPEIWQVAAGETLRLISDAACRVTLAYYSGE